MQFIENYPMLVGFLSGQVTHFLGWAYRLFCRRREIKALEAVELAALTKTPKDDIRARAQLAEAKALAEIGSPLDLDSK